VSNVSIRKVFGASTLALLISATGWAASDGVPTVGWFLGEIAAAKHWDVGSHADPAAAFRAHGIALPSIDAAKRLTEGDVVAVGRALGVALTSQKPAAPFDRARAQTVAATIAIGTGSNETPRPLDVGGTPNDNSDNGQGKKKGHNKSSSEPL
jgi:hypothetical protein